MSSYTADGFNYRMLLLERNSVKGSFRSAHVFPGTHISSHSACAFQSEQQNIYYTTYCRGSIQNFAGGNIDEDDFTVSRMVDVDSRAAHLNALKCCAIRETFEESGILVSTTLMENRKNCNEREPLASLLSSWRQKVNFVFSSFP